MTEVRAAVVYDSLFPATMGGGERLYARIAQLLGERGLPTDYITRQFDDPSSGGPFRIVGVWRGDVYRDDGVRRAGAALAFAFAVFRYFVRRRRVYGLVIASALPVLTVLAVRAALLGTSTRVIADWLEVWSAAKWRAYSGAVTGTVAYVLQRITTRLVREHSVDSRFTGERLRQLRPGMEIVVLSLLDLVPPGTPGPPADPPYVIFVGRFVADKNPAAVPAAVALARSEIPDLRCVIVGTGPDLGLIKSEIARLGLVEEIDLPGRVDDSQLDLLRAGASVLVAPSVREGFGLAIAEASAWGIPAVVVAHEDNAAVDLIEPGVNGFIVPPGDEGLLAAAIVEAVHAGDQLRRSSSEWFLRSRKERSLSVSLDEILNVNRPADRKQ
jgi:glycosyltransferase involved in cell wall biosynthesis